MISSFWLFPVVLLLLDLIFSVTRASFVHVRLPQLITKRDKNPQAVDRTIRLLDKPYLSTSLRVTVALLHFLLAFSAAWLGQGISGAHFMQFQPAFGAALTAWLLAMVLEFVLEGAVLQDVEAWAVRMTFAAALICVLFRPLTWLLLAISAADRAEHKQLSAVTEDELKNWVEDEHPDSSLEKDELRMIYSIFQFGDTLVREIMVPRIDVFALDVDTSVSEAIQAVQLSGHSRLPVYEGTIDNVIGLLYAKDMLLLQADSEVSLRALLRPVYFVPEAKKVDELMAEMQARGVHLSIVVDEYGGMAGLVTLEDIMEEIVGEIRDEYDQSEEQPYQEISPDEYLFQGRIDLDDLNEVLGTHLTKEVADTLGGFIYGQIGRVPVGNEQIPVDGWQLTVEQVLGRRIRKVRAVRIPQSGEVEEKQDETER